MAKSAAADKTKHKPKPANLQLWFFFYTMRRHFVITGHFVLCLFHLYLEQ